MQSRQKAVDHPEKHSGHLPKRKPDHFSTCFDGFLFGALLVLLALVEHLQTSSRIVEGSVGTVGLNLFNTSEPVLQLKFLFDRTRRLREKRLQAGDAAEWKSLAAENRSK